MTAIPFKILDMSQHIGRVTDAVINRPNWQRQLSACYWGADVYVRQSVTIYSITIYTCDQTSGTHIATLLLSTVHTCPHQQIHVSSDSTLKTWSSHAHLCWECRQCSLFTSVVKACMIVLWWGKNNIMLPRMWSFILAEPLCRKLTHIM